MEILADAAVDVEATDAADAYLAGNDHPLLPAFKDYMKNDEFNQTLDYQIRQCAITIWNKSNWDTLNKFVKDTTDGATVQKRKLFAHIMGDVVKDHLQRPVRFHW